MSILVHFLQGKNIYFSEKKELSTIPHFLVKGFVTIEKLQNHCVCAGSAGSSQLKPLVGIYTR